MTEIIRWRAFALFYGIPILFFILWLSTIPLEWKYLDGEGTVDNTTTPPTAISAQVPKWLLIVSHILGILVVVTLIGSVIMCYMPSFKPIFDFIDKASLKRELKHPTDKPPAFYNLRRSKRAWKAAELMRADNVATTSL